MRVDVACLVEHTVHQQAGHNVGIDVGPYKPKLRAPLDKGRDHAVGLYHLAHDPLLPVRKKLLELALE